MILDQTLPQARLYQEWIANRRRLAGIIAGRRRRGRRLDSSASGTWSTASRREGPLAVL